MENTKHDQARAIFSKMKGKPRKDVLAAFVKDAGITESSASTYYQQFRSGGASRGAGRRGRRAKAKRGSKTVRGQRGRPTDPSSKAGVARAIFARLSGKGKSRKEIVAAFQKQAKLTQAGASTYYQKIKEAA